MVLELTAKPDAQQACEMWNHFWAGEVKQRPLVLAQVPRDPDRKVPVRSEKKDRRYANAVLGNYDRELRHIDEILENTLYLAESIPSFRPDHGPDQFAAVAGGTPLRFSQDDFTTNWIDPVVTSWGDFSPQLDSENPTWESLLEYTRRLREHGKGRYVVSQLDFHSNADALSALRNPQRLCLDFMDQPEIVGDALEKVEQLFPLMYNKIYETGEMSETGTTCWIPLWCEGRYATIQSDFLCLVGPEIGKKYILPALEAEASFLDHCIFHLDGRGSLVHLDNLLSIKEIEAIQWVPGAGQPPMHTWTEVLQRCQAAGKKLIVYCGGKDPLGVIQSVLRKLTPAGIVFSVSCRTRAEVDEILLWLKKNT